jgi:DNA repair exonuclease SbcCD ATPase subunit
MASVRIKRITVQAFRGFRDRQSTPELPANGLIGVRGRIKETGGSSGAGKSSVAYAIAYALGFLPFAANKQQNWHTKAPMQVELELDTDQGPAVLRRGKEFSLTVAGTKVEGAAKEVEAALHKLIGLPTDLLEALTYRQQGKRGRFLAMTDAEKKEFLGLLLGTKEVEQQIEQATKAANLAAAEVQVADQVIQAVTNALGKEPAMEPLVDVAPLKLELEAAQVELDVAQAELEALPPFVPTDVQIAALMRDLARVNQFIANAETVARSTRAIMDKELAKLAVTIGDLQLPAAQVYAHKQSLEHLRAELDRAQANAELCPTCRQAWTGGEARIDGLRNHISFTEFQLKSADKARQDLAEATERRDATVKASQEIRNDKLEQLQEVKREIESQLKVHQATENAARTAHMAVQHAAEAKRMAAQRRKANANLAFQGAVADNNRKTYVYQRSTEVYEQQKRALESKKTERDAKQKLATEEADYAAALKSYLGSLFEEILVEISAEANELLKEIPNTPTTTITFTSESVTQKGTTRQEIKPLILKNGADIDVESGLSGGQLQSVELAVDLAITKVIGERTGVHPGFMIFDESFGAHCLPVKQACMHVLQRASQSSLIFVIDHATELRDYFTAFIDVESERDISRFVEGA